MTSLWEGAGGSGHEHEAMCGYCREVITRSGKDGDMIVILTHMLDAHGRSAPLEVYRGEDMDGSEGRWTALARTPEGYE